MSASLNQAQMSAVLCEDQKILCLAGAGTGKTTTMLERISHLVETGVSPSSILVLTFTNAAAFELKDRYHKKHPSDQSPEFRTFHSFCYYVLSTNPAIRMKLGYTEVPTIADDARKKRIDREAGTMTNIKSTIESLSKKTKLSAKEQYEYDMLKKTADRLMKKDNVITFDKLCTSICMLFSTDDPLVQIYKHLYKYIFVDEFQDTDPTQNAFVQSFKDANLFCVGDALQSIYSFRGADSSIIKSLSTDPDWHTIKMNINYRSTQNICDFANVHSVHADHNYKVKIVSGREIDGDFIDRQKFSYVDGLSPIDRKHVDYCIKDCRCYPGDVAILARTNREVDAIKGHFDERNISYKSNNKKIDVPNILTAVGDNEFLIDWLAAHLSVERYADYIRVSTLAQSEGQTYDVIRFINDFGSSHSVNELWEVVRTIRRICKETTRSIMSRCYDILEVLECSNLKLDEEKCLTMKDAVDHIKEIYLGDTEEPGTDIYIGTIHSVKGLEFDNVYVLGVGGMTFKLDNEENKNLYYVAITRAKDHLVVFEKDRGVKFA